MTTNKTITFSKKISFYEILGFTQSDSVELGDIPGFIQLIPGSYQSNKPINNTAFDKIHLKCDCIQKSVVNGVREPVLYSFALSWRPGHKMYKEPRTKLLKKKNKETCIISYHVLSRRRRSRSG